ncbi:Trk family potassium uptake protein [candidate division WOR-3 bacterium]|nr:Trk family potassium uptake protein [candidate division WOR-3 bacterium]
MLPLVVLRQVIVVSGALSRARFLASAISHLRQQTVQTLALSFAALIAVGTLLLTFPAATADGRGAPFLDALFTATSATCVTGLIVRDTPGFFSHFGQLVILGLIQLGALGIMTFSTSVAVILGHRLGLGERRAVAEMVEETRDMDIARAVRYILLFTLLAETLGTIILFLRFLPEFPTAFSALYHALFHSISAFCNAGFSLFSDSLVRYQADFVVNITVIGLVLLGGLGFMVVHEVINRNTLRRGLSPALRELTVHSRIVLTASAILVAAGAVLFFFFEFDRTLAGLPLGTRLLASLFQSVTPRTAGFSTVPLNALHPATLFILVLLMFIGASPGGTGGGIKTTTFAVLLLAVRSRLTSREEIIAGRRSLPRDVVYRATAIAATSAAAVAAIFVFLLSVEAFRFQDLLFETVSAFGTVGLSTGLTPDLSAAGRLGIIVLMYVGRLGPLTLAMAMGARRPRLAIDYPQARVMVG